MKLLSSLQKSNLISKSFDSQELDVLLSSGEQVTCSLLSGAIIDLGLKARSWLGWQIPIMTNDNHTSSQIIKIQTEEILNFISKGGIAVVAGFQGISTNKRITTLGRGGSDLSAVAIAKFFKTDSCEIYTDVEGVLTTDPSINKKAKKIDFQHVDSDLEIIRFTKKSINKIFQEDGEEYFRNIETKIVLKLIEKKNIILSLGGGTILNSLIRGKLKKNSITLFLDVNLLKLEKRLKKSTNRPLLKNVDLAEKVKELDIARRKYYLLSDIIIKNNKSPIDACKNFIEEFVNFHEKTNFNKNQKQKI